MTILTAVLLVALPATTARAASASPEIVSPAERTAAAAITADLIRAHTKFLASDALEGRAPSTRGDRLALEYVATEMEAMGLQPAAPGGGWIQNVPLVAITPKVPATMTFTGAKGSVTLAYKTDFMAVPGVQKKEASVQDAEVVFVGFGIVAPEYQWDDYKNVDVRGKILLMMNNDPEDDPKIFAGKTRLWYGRWDYKYEIAAKKGAIGAIIIHTTPSAGYGWNVIQSSWADEKYELPDEGSQRVAVKGWATDEASKRIAALGHQDLDKMRAAAGKRNFRPVPLGVKLTFAIESSIRSVESGNAIGKIPGSDPALASQVVLYTAHHDHFGRKDEGARPGEDVIYNGARDNASGVAAMLSVAQGYMRLPKAPRRTILFASVTAEEQGLLGSEFLAKHPPVPPGEIAANINIDEVNIWGKTRDVSMVGLGKSSLDGPIREILALQGRVVKADPYPDKGHFYRSDQFNFAKIGVPAAYFDSGTDFIGKPAGWGEEQIAAYEKNDYHQPSDEYRESWNLAGAVEDLQLDFYLGLRVANADAMPRWNKGDEFEAVRLKAVVR